MHYRYDLLSLESQYAEAYEAAQARLTSELRAEADRATDELIDGKSADATNHTREKEKDNSRMTGHTAGPHRAAPERLRPKVHAPKLTHALPVNSMRQDFAEIVTNLQDRASALRTTAAKPSGSVRIVQTDGSFRLCIGTTAFGAGDLVTVFSVLSQESFSGVIMTITNDEVTVRCGSGARLAVHLPQLLEGRVTLSRDTESALALEVLEKSQKRAMKHSQIGNSDLGCQERTLVRSK